MSDYKKVLARKKLDNDTEGVLCNLKMGKAQLGFIAGGCARYFASRDKEAPMYSDIDVFCCGDDIIDAGLNYEALVKRFDDIYHYERTTPNARIYNIKLADDEPRMVQIIRPFENEWMQTYGSIEQVLEQFDFTIVKAAISSECYLIIHKNFDKDEEQKKLVITHINCPIAVAQRCMKYSKKGFRLYLKDTLKLFADWMERPQEYRERLMKLIQDSNDLSPEEIEELEHLLRMD